MIDSVREKSPKLNNGGSGIMKPVNILFCDDNPWRHELFVTRVAQPLLNEAPEGSFKFFFSESLAKFVEDEYSNIGKKLGAKSVESWIEEEKLRADLVVTDLDFTQFGKGNLRTGLEIIEYCQKFAVPWCQYLLISADLAWIANERQFIKLVERGMKYVELNKVSAEDNWNLVKKQVKTLIEEVRKKP
ncbi:MAG: hypothetical protein ACOZAL_01760 [Patescibacteria group bacterium]